MTSISPEGYYGRKYTEEEKVNMMYLSDSVKQTDRHHMSLITIKNELGEVLHRGLHNKVIVSGSAFTMMKHYNLDVPTRTPSYNQKLGLENSIYEEYDQPGVRRDEIVCLFAVGIGGCGNEQHQVYPVNYAKWIQPDTELVPFRLLTPPNDLSPLQRTQYFGRKVMADGKIAYYFKAFDTEPELLQRYVDGTPIDEGVHTSSNTLEIESFVQLKLKVSVDDCREYFRATTGIDYAKLNTLSLLTAWKTEKDGFVYYQDIRPMTKLNFSSEPLCDNGTKALDITYLTFY